MQKLNSFLLFFTSKSVLSCKYSIQETTPYMSYHFQKGGVLKSIRYANLVDMFLMKIEGLFNTSYVDQNTMHHSMYEYA